MIWGEAMYDFVITHFVLVTSVVTLLTIVIFYMTKQKDILHDNVEKG